MTTSPKRIEEYLKLYREDKSYEQIGKVFGLGGSAVYNTLKRAGKLESRRVGNQKTSLETIEEYVKLYGEGKSYREIGKIFWLGGHSIRKALKNAGRLESRSAGRPVGRQKT